MLAVTLLALRILTATLHERDGLACTALLDDFGSHDGTCYERCADLGAGTLANNEDFIEFNLCAGFGIDLLNQIARTAAQAPGAAVLVESARSFPDNSEFESLLTFTGPGTGAWMPVSARSSAVPSNAVLTLRGISCVVGWRTK